MWSSDCTNIVNLSKVLRAIRGHFSLFSSFLQNSSKWLFIKSCWRVNSNPGPLESEVTALSNLPHHCPNLGKLLPVANLVSTLWSYIILESSWLEDSRRVNSYQRAFIRLATGQRILIKNKILIKQKIWVQFCLEDSLAIFWYTIQRQWAD